MSHAYRQTQINRPFPHTDWSLVRAVQVEDTDNQREVLGQFLEQYLPAMQSHLLARRFYKNEHDVEDLLADFVSDKIVANHLLRRVSQGDGKLRTYLSTCIDNYAKSKLRKRAPIGLNAVGGQELDMAIFGATPAAHEKDIFDYEWARTVVDRSIAMTRVECLGPADDRSELGQEHIWRVFEARLVLPMTGQLDDPVSYESLCVQLGATSTKQVQNWLVTGIRKFQKNISTVVGEYAASSEQIEVEIGELFEILRGQSAY